MKLYVLLISLVACLGGFLFGFDTAVISGVIEIIQRPDIFGLDEISKGWTVSSILVGCILGCLVAGKSSDIFGRKNILMFSAFLFFVSAIGCAVSNDWWLFMVFRVLGGIGVGAASMLSPMYIAEISPPAIRGRLVSFNQLTIVLGITAAFFTNYYINSIDPENWRLMIGIMAVPSVMFFALLFTVPESPRWLVQKGRKNEAYNTLVKINNKEIADKEIIMIEDSVSAEKIKMRLKDIFTGSLSRITIVAILLGIAQQVTGINVIIYYAPLIFKEIGLGIDAALLNTVLVGVVSTIFTFVSILFVDKMGRKLLMLIGITGMGLFQFLIAFSFLSSAFGPYTTLIFICGYIASFASSMGPVMWVVISEIFPNRIRSIGVSVAVIFVWAANFLVSFTFPVILNFFKQYNEGYTFFIYGSLCILTFIFIKVFIPETKNKSLEEIEKELVKERC